MSNHSPQVNRTRFLHTLAELSQIGRQPNGAVHRVGYSPADLAARRWLNDRLRSIGLEVQVDAAGNSIAIYPGSEALPPIAIGSHSDTVPFGGAYDGSLGVVAALETLAALHDAKFQPRHPIAWLNFAAEEATMGGGTTGSQAMAGNFNMAMLDKAAWDGQKVRTHLSKAGLEPEKMLDAQRAKGEFAAFLELHIEQSDRLEKTGQQIAIADGFVGIRRYSVRFEGQANHAGTTPMARRQDALVMAAPMIHFVRDVAVELGIVGTIGDFNVYPGAPNVIPERVELVVEIRGTNAVILDQAQAIIEEEVGKLGGVFDPIVIKPPVLTDPIIREAIDAACQNLALNTMTMSSGAGHDGMNMALLCPQCIFFVPSKDGMSHSKEEYSSPEDCFNGASVMLNTLLILDQRL